jgi:hypothetical protein
MATPTTFPLFSSEAWKTGCLPKPFLFHHLNGVSTCSGLSKEPVPYQEKHDGTSLFSNIRIMIFVSSLFIMAKVKNPVVVFIGINIQNQKRISGGLFIPKRISRVIVD